jgi:hypothetical protein
MPEEYGTSEPVPAGYFGQMLHSFRRSSNLHISQYD